MKHLSIRVAWHDSKWNGCLCKDPNANTFCLQLPRIYEEKDDNEEKEKNWSDISPNDLPPCKAEAGAFMNLKSYKREFIHPYQFNPKAEHSHLMPTIFEVPSFSAFAVPFWWMLNSNQKKIDNLYPGLPEINKTPFPSPWVYSEKRQRSLLSIFFDQIESSKSLVLFYTKNGNPIDENSRRLLVGIGTITEKGNILEYNKKSIGTDYPLWDRMISHSIRNDGDKGFLIPYHEYLELPEDFTIKIKGEIKNKPALIDEIKVSMADTGLDESIIDELSYGSELLSDRNILSILEMLRKIVENIKSHGIVKGKWDKHIIWINEQIGKVKEAMGPFPSFAETLISIGFKQGYFYSQDIYNLNLCEAKGNPWDIFIKTLKGKFEILKDKSYYGDFAQFNDIWNTFTQDDKELLILLSRLSISSKQIKAWFDPDERKKNNINYTVKEIFENPYLLVEDNISIKDEYPVSIEKIDEGVFEDRAIQGEHIPVKPYRVDSSIDPKRIRAVIIQLLKDSAEQGDTLLSTFEIRQMLLDLKLPKSCELPPNYIEANIDYIKQKLEHFKTEHIDALQLKIYCKIESDLQKIFIARAKTFISSLNEDWGKLIIETIKESDKNIDLNNERHKNALEDQKNALEKVTTRKLSILHGPAGTGKTSVMGALVRSKKLQDKGILLLAPTGKARVRLGTMSKSQAFTIAQFLTKQKRFDWLSMKPKFTGKDKYKVEKTIIIDECSMLTEDDFYAIFQSLDLGHVERIIMVGDPYQLPPIGAGRPFADLCAYLEGPFTENDDTERIEASKALAQLEVVVRATEQGKSDALLLASWFAGKKPGKNHDEIFDKILDNSKLNDLCIEMWETPDKLEETIKKIIKKEIIPENDNDIKGFDIALGVIEGKFPINKPEVVENFQFLTPVKNPIWGSYPLNRLIQNQYRKRPSNKWDTTLGEQQIWIGDKVIQLNNEWRNGFKNDKKTTEEFQLSNGQIGYLVNFINGFGNTCFSGLSNITFGYNSRDFKENGSKLELAYVITIHKSQGSDFKKVFMILPKTGRILSRELLYTGLTRSKDRLILLVEGTDPFWIFNYSKAEASETARRNTHLFKSNIRDSKNSIPYVQNLIHKTKNGIYVRSKSEVIVANLLHDAGIEFEYERRYESEFGNRLPDFTFIDSAGNVIILEHLGLLHKPSYREEWEVKKNFYKNNGFKDDINLFITKEDENGAIDSEYINNKIIPKIKELLI